MAAPMESSNDPAEGETSSSFTPAKPLNWYSVMERMIGEKKQYNKMFEAKPGFFMPPKSPQEIRAQKVFDSCLFKTCLSCVAGELGLLLNKHRIHSAFLAHLWLLLLNIR